jgi:competence protein ComEC
VASYCAIFFGWFVRRRRAQALSILAVLAYAALVGFSPPVLRATIMGIVLVVARISGRRSSGLTSILFAAALMTALDPLIISDVSFQLSFAATAGILALAAPLWSALLGGT